MKIVLAEPRGVCAGVDRAVKIVEEALERILPHVQGIHVHGHGGDVDLELKIARLARARSGEAGGVR